MLSNRQESKSQRTGETPASAKKSKRARSWSGSLRKREQELIRLHIVSRLSKNRPKVRSNEPWTTRNKCKKKVFARIRKRRSKQATKLSPWPLATWTDMRRRPRSSSKRRYRERRRGKRRSKPRRLSSKRDKRKWLGRRKNMNEIWRQRRSSDRWNWTKEKGSLKNTIWRKSWLSKKRPNESRKPYRRSWRTVPSNVKTHSRSKEKPLNRKFKLVKKNKKKESNKNNRK